jgi:hypothetical protein
MSIRDANKMEPCIPNNSLKQDGYSKDGEATATCYCGAIQLAFVSQYLFVEKPIFMTQHSDATLQPTAAPGLIDTFICHCTDCRKITASAFTSAFVVAVSAVKHIRGQQKLREFAQSKTIASGRAMTNYFCDTCGTLMYRLSEAHPDISVMRLGM